LTYILEAAPKKEEVKTEENKETKQSTAEEEEKNLEK